MDDPGVAWRPALGIGHMAVRLAGSGAALSCWRPCQAARPLERSLEASPVMARLRLPPADRACPAPRVRIRRRDPLATPRRPRTWARWARAAADRPRAPRAS